MSSPFNGLPFSFSFFLSVILSLSFLQTPASLQNHYSSEPTQHGLSYLCLALPPQTCTVCLFFFTISPSLAKTTNCYVVYVVIPCPQKYQHFILLDTHQPLYSANLVRGRLDSLLPSELAYFFITQTQQGDGNTPRFGPMLTR